METGRDSRTRDRRFDASTLFPFLPALLLLIAPGTLAARPPGDAAKSAKSSKAVPLDAPHARTSRPLVTRKIRGAVVTVSRGGQNRTAPAFGTNERNSSDVSGMGSAVAPLETSLGETPLHALGGSAPRTPALTTGPFDLSTGGNDPNIAASNSYLVASTNGRIRFYSKSGQRLVTDRGGNSFDADLQAWQIFAPLFQGPGNVNEGLNLPGGLKCDSSIFVFDPNLTAAQRDDISSCLSTVYDSRVLFDDYRKRFWILASVRNGSEGDFMDLPIIEQRVGRRDRLLLAVSTTEDPREEWNLYVLPSTLDLGKCNDIGEEPGPPPACPGSIYHPGEDADYPSIGIGRDWVVTTINVGSPNPFETVKAGENRSRHHKWTSINVYDAGKLANGTCGSACGWNFGPVDLMGYPQKRLRNTVAPVKQRGVSDPAWSLLAQPVKDPPRLLVLAVKGPLGKKPALTGAFVPIADYTGPTDIPQPKIGNAPQPVQIRIGNMGSGPMHAVARGRKLFTVFQDCYKGPSDDSDCTGALRLVGVDFVKALTNPTVSTSPLVDRRFGRRNILDDPEDALIWYASPAVEINGDGHVVVVYNRAGPDTFLESSYTALFHGEPDIRPSSPLRRGDGVVVNTDDPCCHMDSGGIAADPRDDKSIWMLHAYADNAGTVSFALGKVFGAPMADLSVWTGDGIRLPSGGLHAGAKATVTVHVENGGDGTYPSDAKGSGRGTVSFHKGNTSSQETAATFEIPKLDPGQGEDIAVAIEAPRHPELGPYTLRVEVKPSVPDYSTKNNSGARPVRIAN